ncbi:response regulator transcription factor [Pararobbsia alpina]|uniref:response regulator transcription factor n=1 Tax=Pararobbsia alpina TaxID=621374 RepID=UPI0039A69064
MLACAVETAQPSVVYVVDDDSSVRDGVGRLLRSVGLQTEVFDDTDAFLAFHRPQVPSCLILDIRLRNKNGLAFQQDMARLGVQMPVVIATGFGDVEMSVKAMKAGASDFIEKPFREQDLLDAVNSALARDTERIVRDRAMEDTRSSYHTLTPREREVLNLILRGLMSKQIAAEIGVTAITVKLHRAQIMKKMGVRSVASLALKAAALGIEPSPV